MVTISSDSRTTAIVVVTVHIFVVTIEIVTSNKSGLLRLFQYILSSRLKNLLDQEKKSRR